MLCVLPRASTHSSLSHAGLALPPRQPHAPDASRPTGSGGMSVNQMAQGAAAAVGLAQAVNAARGADQPRIDCIDVGGGLPVSWGRDVPQSPTLQEYSSALREAAPALFDGESFPRVITEFGAILNCKMAFFASIVGE